MMPEKHTHRKVVRRGGASTTGRRGRTVTGQVDGPPRLLRTSELRSFTACRQQWWWGWHERIRPRYTSPPLRFGSLIHKALELRYPPGTRRGPHPAETFARLYEEELKSVEGSAAGWSLRDAEEEWRPALELGVGMMTNFTHRYGTDDRYRVLASEMSFEQPVWGADGRLLFVYCGTMDGLWQDVTDGSILIHDWKTTSQIQTSHLPLDPQASGYWTFGQEWLRHQGILKPTQKLRGMMYTFLRKAVPDERPTDEEGRALNKDGTPSKRQPAPYFERFFDYKEARQQHSIRDRVIKAYHELARVEADPRALVYKEPDRDKCKFCALRPVCILHDIGADADEYARQTCETWEPYAAHEIQTDERQ